MLLSFLALFHDLWASLKRTPSRFRDAAAREQWHGYPPLYRPRIQDISKLHDRGSHVAERTSQILRAVSWNSPFGLSETTPVPLDK